MVATIMRKLNVANSQMLSRVTGKSVRDEARESTTSFDILKHIRKMRLKWLGDILRSDPDRMIYQCIHLQMHLNNPGSILMDAPSYQSMNELRVLATDEAFWNEHILSI